MHKIILSSKCLYYNSPMHPESPERVKSSYEFLKNKNEFLFLKPEAADNKDILLVHTKNLLDKVTTGMFFDLDTPALPNIIEYAKLSAGAAIKAAKLAAKGEKTFSLMRPPGHHAEKDRLGGFCYFNNIAIAIKKIALKSAIIDIDCHHGNGTEDIFMGNPDVLYVSLHQNPLYPGTGLVSSQNCLNFPLSPNTGETEYLLTLENAVEKVKDFNPNIIGISVGFDTYKDDPITNLNLEIESYGKIARIIDNLNKPCFATLEGGYSKYMPECVYSFLKGFK